MLRVPTVEVNTETLVLPLDGVQGVAVESLALVPNLLGLVEVAKLDGLFRMAWVLAQMLGGL